MQKKKSSRPKKLFDDAVCAWCEDQFSPARKWQMFCSVECRGRAWHSKHPKPSKNAATIAAKSSDSDGLSSASVQEPVVGDLRICNA